ncbi:hypothetical protein BASA60_007923 [Batrachochytrium salamandrivorans]|nr:hypothetical protein BASA62_005871 [Batrachochytrium salamandrivorans]KAH6570105.1 hypothetical protein BASA60_007923 [Batrachochytrium salamandrivorans]KAH9273050.1 hypothetical protein BASA83_004620 [Batrachochytrium salamandrivorans]
MILQGVLISKVTNAVSLLGALSVALALQKPSLWISLALLLHSTLLVAGICQDISRRLKNKPDIFRAWEYIFGFVSFVINTFAAIGLVGYQPIWLERDSWVLNLVLLLDVMASLVFWGVCSVVGLLFLLAVLLDDDEDEDEQENTPAVYTPLSGTGKRLEAFIFELLEHNGESMFSKFQSSTTDPTMRRFTRYISNHSQCHKGCHGNYRSCSPANHKANSLALEAQRRASLNITCAKPPQSSWWDRRFSQVKPARVLQVPLDDAVCTICLSKYIPGERLHQLDCTHHYHASCIKSWLNVNNLCPLCNAAVTGVDLKLDGLEEAELRKYVGTTTWKEEEGDACETDRLSGSHSVTVTIE